MWIIRKKNIEILPEDEVHLPAIAGIPPELYLMLLYILGGLVLLFFLFLYPGLSRPGAYLTVTSEPWGVAVRVDDVYQGTTPCTIWVPDGSHNLTLLSPGFSPRTEQIHLRGRRVATLLFPDYRSYHYRLSEGDPETIILKGAQIFAQWALVGEPSVSYQIPLSLSEAVYRGTALSVKEDLEKETTPLGALIESCVPFVSNPVSLRDLVRAHIFVRSKGCTPSPITGLEALRRILTFLQEHPRSAIWLTSVLPTDTAQTLLESSWYRRVLEEGNQDMALFEKPLPATPVESITIEGIRFFKVKGGVGLSSGSFPYRTTVQDFWIAEQEIRLEDWNRFVQSNSQWSAERRQSLLEQGMVGSSYLQEPEFVSYPAGSAPGISWYAAKAYCDWLSTRVPLQLKNRGTTDPVVRLPTEQEWEYAARWNRTTQLLKNMEGGLWEWCENPYVPHDYIIPSTPVSQRVGSPERVVRGGSWINPTIDRKNRGSLPPGTSSFFVGFRPVIAPPAFSAF